MMKRLLRWFRTHQRPLPWRKEPREAYHVWVSEVMLQQTRVETVQPYFVRWIERFPDVRSLAGASIDEVLKAWEGLGYYRRARNLHLAAHLLVSRYEGSLPSTVRQLKALPGIGSYTAAAIASIAFGKDAVAVDGNIRRVAARLFGLEGAILDVDVETRLAPIFPAGAAGAANEALMELGALICLPVGAQCARCPIRAWCGAAAQDRVHELPQRRQRPPVPHVKAAALVFRKGAKVYLRKRSEEEMLGGLWGFPLLCDPPPLVPGARALRAVRHAYTHFKITATPWVLEEPYARYGERADACEGAFILPSAARGLALSRLDHKILDILAARA